MMAASSSASRSLGAACAGAAPSLRACGAGTPRQLQRRCMAIRRRRLDDAAGADADAARVAEAVAAAAGAALGSRPGAAAEVATDVNVAQRSPEWHSLRADRLTASCFGGVVGFFSRQRVQLWEEKAGLAPPFAGNEYTRWGTRVEDAAVLRYSELTGNSVRHEGFRTYGDWLGGSPDGLIAAAAAAGGGGGGGGASSPGGGVLEVKCPSKPSPYTAMPYTTLPLYYMPQMQGLMHIFDREFCDLYAWTSVNGSALFRVPRDREYWAMLEEDLRRFWFEHVVPARRARAGGGADARAIASEFGPGDNSSNAKDIKARGRQLAKAAVEMRFIQEHRGL